VFVEEPPRAVRRWRFQAAPSLLTTTWNLRRLP